MNDDLRIGQIGIASRNTATNAVERQTDRQHDVTLDCARKLNDAVDHFICLTRRDVGLGDADHVPVLPNGHRGLPRPGHLKLDLACVNAVS